MLTMIAIIANITEETAAAICEQVIFPSWIARFNNSFWFNMCIALG